MNKLKLVTLLAVVLLGTASVSAQDTESNVAITLERTACHGVCPVYTVTILDDGTVIYEGQEHVAVTGQQTSEIDPATVQEMVAAFEDAGYFDWDESYETQTVSDLSTVTTSVTRDGETHRIARYVGDYTAPLALSFLELWIDTMTNTGLWTGVQADLSAVSNGTDTPVVTLQQGACFGFCPTYNVALYADGTTVFMGIGNVPAMGVHILQTDAAAVSLIAESASIFGYFDWKDSYEQYVKTDGAVVITSVRWQDQSKRITRYDGDPNAPIGLVWLEESIARTVTDLIT
jgi:hypothetical protein